MAKESSFLLDPHTLSLLGDISRSFGFNRLLGQIYAFLFFAGKPVPVEDLIRALKSSKGNVSMNIRELERLEAVRRVRISGSRKTYFRIEKDFLGVAKTHFGLAIRKRMKLADEFFNLLKDRLPENKSAESDSAGNKYKELVRLYGQVKELLTAFFPEK